MKFLLHLPFLALIGCLLPASVARPAEPADTGRGEIQARRILFLGNSITRHAPLASIGWTGDWGMAASAREKDYAHVLARTLGELTGHPPEILTANIAEFERNAATYDASARLKDELAFHADLVIVAIGENVPPLDSDEAKATFQASLVKLLTALKTSGQSALFVRSCFWADAAKDAILRRACATAGGVFVDISQLGQDPANSARSERTIAHEGVAGHPGDRGMQAIADALLAAIQREAPRAR